MDHPIVMGTAGGEYMETAVVVEWTRAPGDRVEAGQTVAVLETAKAGFEIEASHSGVLKEILFAVGQEAPVGAVLGRISDAASPAAEIAPASGRAPAQDPAAKPAPPAPAKAGENPARARVVATPLARRVARDRGIDLSAVSGTGPGGRIKLRDLGDGARPAPAPVTFSEPPPAPQTGTSGQPVAATPPEAVRRPRASEIPIVLVHGFGADRTAWRQVTPLLSAHRPMVLVELPGHGSEPSAPVRGIDDLAFALADQLDRMGIGEAHLVGHSLGGAAALSLAATGPLTVRSLCLIAPAGLGPEIDGAFIDGFLAATKPESLDPWLARMVADPRRLPPGFARAVLRRRDSSDAVAAQRAIASALFPDGMQAIRLSDALSELAVPSKLIWGLADAVIPSRHAFAAGGGTALHLLRGVGHVPQMEAPALVARLIDELARSQS